MAKGERHAVKAKGKCCESNPRCKRCPVVFKRLEKVELAQRTGKRTWTLSPELKHKALRKARQRELA